MARRGPAESPFDVVHSSLAQKAGDLAGKAMTAHPAHEIGKFRVKDIVKDRWWPDVIGRVVRVRPKLVVDFAGHFWEYDKEHQRYLEKITHEVGKEQG